MRGNEVYEALSRIGATHLYHANSVTTSCTFLEQAGLLSRGLVEDHALRQTPQNSDQKDKRYGIWHHVFLDHVDIHHRAGRARAPNEYGPVLFALELNFLLALPGDTDVLVTRSNPTYWYDDEPDERRWFRSVEELVRGMRFGEFAQMLVIQTPLGRIDFPNRRAGLILDDPQRQLSSGENAYAHAQNRLTAAATVGRIDVCIEQRACCDGCVCIQQYAAQSVPDLDLYFG